MISEEELDSIREQQNLLMPCRATLRRKHYDGDEFITEDLATDVPCRIARGYGFWRQVADRFAGINAHVLTFQYDQEVQAGDQLVDTTDSSSDPDIYEIRDLRGKGSYLTARQALADLVK